MKILPTPSDAKVQIMNIKPKYHERMKLKKDKYKIRVSKEGYITKNITINLKEDITQIVTLGKRKNRDKHITTIGNLMWQDELYTKVERKAHSDNRNNGKVGKWGYSIDYCKKLTLGGYSDWRLPDKDELKSLYGERSRLKHYTSDYYWSSSVYVSSTKYAWMVYLGNGHTHYYNKVNAHYVRCVRADNSLFF